MAISRFSTSSVAQGLPKYQKLWDGTSTYSASSFESIATTTVGSGGTSTITFSSIPSTYKNLQVRYFARATLSVTDCESVLVRFNSDSGSNYNRHYMLGDGGGIYPGSSTPTSIDGGLVLGSGLLASCFSPGVIDISDYNDTNKQTSIKTFSGGESNRGGSQNYVEFQSGLWRNTAAVTSITITTSGTSFAEYSHFALYGIKG